MRQSTGSERPKVRKQTPQVTVAKRLSHPVLTPTDIALTDHSTPPVDFPIILRRAGEKYVSGLSVQERTACTL
ncbi:MAG: hypothetical protein AB7K24_30485, partial [Gemmataceae bacterium]